MLASVLAAVALSAAAQNASFDAGVAAYRAGDTQGALTAFEQARAQGHDDAPLHFNLGLCYYRLGRFSEAKAEFSRLRAYPGYEHIADFHLGLVAAREGRGTDAEALWLGVEQSAPQAPMRQRARIARSRLTNSIDAVPSGYVLAAFARDGNPALLDEARQDDAASGTIELFGSYAHPLFAVDSAVDWLRAGAWLRDYDEADGLDQRGVYGAYVAERVDGQRRDSAAFEVGATQLDGERFTDTFSVSFEDEPRPGGAGFAFGAQLAYLGAGPGFEALEGWRARGDVERIARWNDNRLRTGYQLELNDRDSDSHSATRHRLTVALDRNTGRWGLRYQLRWRASDYADDRSETLLQAGVQARRALGHELNALLEYQYSRNQSSADLFDYDRHLALLGVEWLPRAD